MQQLQTLWEKYNEKYRAELILLGGLLAVCLLYWIITVPLRERRQDAAQNITAFRAQITKLQAYDMPAAEFEDKKRELLTRQAKLQNILPQAVDDFEAIMQLTQDIKAHNLNVRGIKANSSAQQGTHTAQRLDGVVSGSYFELVALLEYLHRRSPLTNVQISSINAEADDRLSVSMQVYIYILE